MAHVLARSAAALVAAMTMACSGAELVTPASLPADPRVEATIASMTDRYTALLDTCDHRGLFQLAYLRTTDAYLAAAEQPGFFRDPAYLNDEDTLFAKYYFDHVDDWTSGRQEKVPPAWKVAFQSSEAREVSTVADALLGISAHINQDLPYVLATLGVTDAEGHTRKPDHERVNVFLATVQFDADIRAHWDPTYDIDYLSELPTIIAWRETAWQFALDLIAAETPADRAAVDARIAANAEGAAVLFAAVSKYSDGGSSAARDAYCAAHP